MSSRATASRSAPARAWAAARWCSTPSSSNLNARSSSACFQRAIDFDEMEDVYYPRVRSVIRSAPIPDDILATEYYRSSRVSLEQAVMAGFPTRPVDLAVDWDIVREEIAGLKVPSAIAGQSFYGLNSGAKRSLDHNYLPQAEATGHVEILPLHTAIAIEHGHGGRYAVTIAQPQRRGRDRRRRRGD